MNKTHVRWREASERKIMLFGILLFSDVNHQTVGPWREGERNWLSSAFWLVISISIEECFFSRKSAEKVFLLDEM
jgi:hypothetical protein